MIQTREKRFLKDQAAKLILGDESCREYLIHIIAASLNFDLDYVRDNLKVVDTHVGSHLDLKNQETDLLFETSNEFLNIEINYNYYKDGIVKNICYIANLLIRQTKKEENYHHFKKIYQINLDNYDLYKQGRFLYRSFIMEEKTYLRHDDMITIIDINLDFLSTLEYTHIKDLNETDLEWLLYLFVCSNELERNTLYEDNRLMRKVFLKMDNLIRNLNEDLYYDPEEFRNRSLYHQGYDEGLEEGKKEGMELGEKQNKLEIAKKMILKHKDIQEIIEFTELSEDEINELKKNIQK